MRKILLVLFLLLNLSSPALATNWCEDAETVGCWQMEEGSGTTTSDESSNSNTGSFVSSGNPAWTSIDTAEDSANFTGTSNYAIEISSDFVSVADDNTLDLSATLSFTGYIRSIDTTRSYQKIITKRDGSSGIWDLDIRSSGKLNFGYNDGSWRERITSSAVVSEDTWHHVAVTYVGGTGTKIYVDGNEKSTTGSTTYNNLPTNTYPVRFGAYNLSGMDDSYFSGQIDEFILSSQTLDSTDISDIMDNGLVQATARRRMMIIQ